MQEFSDATDIPPVIVVERRHLGDRRSFWRGGRRNTDWMRRPIGAWRQMEQSLSPWRQWFAKRLAASHVMHAAGARRGTRQ
jgi:hypothetical protein